jgi:hypothetical protein
MSKYHTIKKIVFNKSEIILSVEGKILRLPLEKFSQKLLKASSHERLVYEISPSGYGIHWPLIDEDLSIDGLLGISHQRLSKKKAA